MKTRKWGKIEYPKGTNPVVIEVKVDGSSDTFKLGVREDIDILKKELEEKVERELEKHQKAEITINFPKMRKKIKFSAIGEQPITPPVIYHGGWPPPEHMILEIKEELRRNPKRKTASDTEALAYLYTASLATPFNEDWCNIYFYLNRKYLKRKGWKKFEGDLEFLKEHKSLSDHEKRLLQNLKDWIWKKQQRVLAERRKRSKQLMKEACPGAGIRSKGKGKGKGFGRGKGPVGVPKK